MDAIEIRTRCLKELNGLVLSVVSLRSLTKLSILDNLLFSLGQLLHLLFEDLLHIDEVSTMNGEPILVPAASLWLEAHIIEGGGDLGGFRNNLARIRDASTDLLRLGGTRTKFASCESLLPLLRVKPLIELFLVHRETIVEATEIFDLQVGFLGSDLRTVVDHDQELLLILVNLDTVLEGLLLFLELVDLLLLIVVEVIETNWPSCDYVSEVDTLGELQSY